MPLNGRQCSVPVCYQILYAITRNTSYLDLTANATCSFPNYASVMILTCVTAMLECTMYDVLQTYYNVLYMFVCVVLPRMHLTITLPSRVITYCCRQSCYGPEMTGFGARRVHMVLQTLYRKNTANRGINPGKSTAIHDCDMSVYNSGGTLQHLSHIR